MPRVHVDTPLGPGIELELPPNATRHVQVLRLQPGDALTLFDGQGGQWQAAITAMGRKAVMARVGEHEAVDCELPAAITLATAMPTNDRMDTLVEKATELGAAAIEPLMTSRSVLRVDGDRAERKARHWLSIAQAACEQCGRNRVPELPAPTRLADAWSRWAGEALASRRLLLSLSPQAQPLLGWLLDNAATAPVVLLSGPEGGLTDEEQAEAVDRGFQPVSLGPRVLRADTAPLAALAVIAAHWGASGH